jgi:hypothetical protein
MKGECRRARKALQDLHDAGVTPSGRLARHLIGCRECADFQGFLGQLSSGLKTVLDEPLDRVPAPDYSALPLTQHARHVPANIRRLLIPIAASVLSIAVAVPSTILAVEALRERAAMREAVAAFVDDLFSTSPLGDEGFSKGGAPAQSQVLDSLLDELAARRD